MSLQPVILCGGSGTRLWPLSRESHPKQLLPLLGDETLLQATLQRLDGFDAKNLLPPLVVGNEKYRFLIADQMRSCGTTGGSLLLEPFGRGTAPALTLAALIARENGSDPTLLAMPADHLIADASAFKAAVATGLAAAESGAVITFGVQPTRAETDYGYLLRGEPDHARPGAFALDAFVEKPDIATAQVYLENGRYLWNSGIFMLRASVWLAAIERLQPLLFRACSASLRGLQRDGVFLRIDREAFAECPADSIDYAVMEKLHDHPELGAALIVPLDARWSDVGAWHALWEVSDKDAHGNVARGDVWLEDTRNSLIIAQSRAVVALGCADMVIVETPDAVLVSDRGRSQEVRKMVARLKAEQRPEASAHRKVYRPWGWYDSIEHGPGFQVKRISVDPGASLSLQFHHRRAEHWIVVRGTARVTCGENVFDLHENGSTFIPQGTRHRLENLTGAPVEIIEVQTGEYLGEDDIVRLEDRYARI